MDNNSVRCTPVKRLTIGISIKVKQSSSSRLKGKLTAQLKRVIKKTGYDAIGKDVLENSC
jgi:hypothetical protein